jgi:phosphatidylserine decarboxylase
VGALIVASIETVWDGPASPYQIESAHKHNVSFAKGAEIGRFLLGSTVIVCTQAGKADFLPDLAPGSAVRMGRSIASFV